MLKPRSFTATVRKKQAGRAMARAQPGIRDALTVSP